jgi:hypothetical protein
MKANDLSTTPLEHRREVTLLLTPETEELLNQVAKALLNSSKAPKFPDPDYGRRAQEKWDQQFVHWGQYTAPPEIRRRYAMMSMNKSYEAACEWLRGEYEKISPRPGGTVGRPKWYVHPSKKLRVAAGDALALMLERIGSEMMAEWTPMPKTKYTDPDMQSMDQKLKNLRRKEWPLQTASKKT